MTETINSKRELVTIASLNKKAKDKVGVELKTHELTRLLKSEMGLVWKAVRPQEIYVNSERNILLRQAFAVTLIDTLNAGKKLINIDESVIGASTSRKHSWENRGR